MARSLGRTLEELGETCSANEFGLWQALYAQDPWGSVRIDVAGAVVAATIANCNRAKDTPAFKPVDFMPFAEKPPEPQAEPLTGADFLKDFL